MRAFNRLALAALVLLITHTNVLAANITNIPKERFHGQRILIQGEIKQGDYEKFIDVVLQSGSPEGVVIGSRGGDVIVAMQIGDLIRSLRLGTEVPYLTKGGGAGCDPEWLISNSNCTCLSACFLISLPLT